MLKSLSTDQSNGTHIYIIIIVIYAAFSYALYLILDSETISWIGVEDGLIEYLTALFFLGSSYYFMRAYLSHKNYFFLLLSIIMFFGFGEEISWGQRILNFSTPEYLADINVQKEFTIHNIEIFNTHNFDHTSKSGLARLLEINFLYKLFWLGFCIVLPITNMTIPPISKLLNKIRLPIPPLQIGIFFLVNWLIYKFILSFLLPEGETLQYYDTIVEMREEISALIFFALGHYFYKKGRGITST